MPNPFILGFRASIALDSKNTTQPLCPNECRTGDFPSVNLLIFYIFEPRSSNKLIKAKKVSLNIIKTFKLFQRLKLSASLTGKVKRSILKFVIEKDKLQDKCVSSFEMETKRRLYCTEI